MAQPLAVASVQAVPFVDGVHLVDTHAVQVIGRLLHGVQHGGGIAVREWDHQVRAGTDVVEHRLWRKRARPVGHRAGSDLGSR